MADDSGHNMGGPTPSSSRFEESFGAIGLSGRRGGAVATADADLPLIIAIHGGGYTSAYFDLPGFSLVERASGLGIPIIAIDRPGYVQSPGFAPAEATIANNAERLNEAIGELWQRFGGGTRGVFLIGHSIGGAITIAIAARQPSWPLLGIAISGVGLVTPPASGEQWAALPDIPMIDMPPHLKDYVMFGPDWTHTADAPARSHAADAPCPRAELIDITSTWHGAVRPLAARVQVPVHYRQGEFDRLWITGPEQVAGFGAAFTGAPRVDAAAFDRAGHCIDFHRLGQAFQLEQLAFALNCCVPRAAG